MRQVAKSKKIKEINENDHRVKILGVIIEKNSNDNTILLDDGTGIALIYLTQEQFDKVHEGDIVRIFGRVLEVKDDRVEIISEVIQNLKNINIGLYEMVSYLVKKLKGEENV